MEDVRIIELYVSRDEQAIRETMQKYGRPLHSLAYTIVANDEDAEECVSDTYLSAWKLIPPHTPYTYFFAFLARITRHLALNSVKKAGRQKRCIPLTELSAELQECLPAQNDFAEKEIAAAISAFLHTLPTRTRQIFVRRYWYMQSIAEISKMFGYSQSKTASLLFRTRKALKIYLERSDISV